MKFKHKALALGLTALLSFGAAAPAFAVPSQAELNAAGARLEELGNELAAYEQKLAEQGEKLEQTQYDISKTEDEIEHTKVELEAARAVLSQRMRSGYKTGISSVLDVLFNASSFEDLVSRIYYMDKISENDADAISVVQQLEEDLNGQMSDLKEQETALEEQLEATNAQVDEYQAKVAEAQNYYDSLDAQIQEELARQAAEEAARREAEEAAAREAAAAQEAAQAAAAQQANGVEAAINTVGGNQSTTNTASNSSSSSNSSSASSGSSSVVSGGGLSSAYAAIGSPYVWGAAGPNSFDCSGLVCYCYGYGRGRDTYSMIASLQSTGSWKTSMSQLAVGDLVFPSSGHVGIYIGNGQMIHAPSPGRSVCIQSVYSFFGGGTY